MEIKKSRINIAKLNKMGYLCVPVTHKSNEYAKNLLNSLGASDDIYNKTYRIYIKESESGKIQKVYLILKQEFNSHTLAYNFPL